MASFFYSVDGENVEGPISESALLEAWWSGALPDTTQICADGQEGWQQISIAFPQASRRQPRSKSKKTRLLAGLAGILLVAVAYTIYGQRSPNDPSGNPVFGLELVATATLDRIPPPPSPEKLTIPVTVEGLEKLGYRNIRQLDEVPEVMRGPRYVLSAKLHKPDGEIEEFPELADDYWDIITVDVGAKEVKEFTGLAGHYHRVFHGNNEDTQLLVLETRLFTFFIIGRDLEHGRQFIATIPHSNEASRVVSEVMKPMPARELQAFFQSRFHILRLLRNIPESQRGTFPIKQEALHPGVQPPAVTVEPLSIEFERTEKQIGRSGRYRIAGAYQIETPTGPGTFLLLFFDDELVFFLIPGSETSTPQVISYFDLRKREPTMLWLDRSAVDVGELLASYGFDSIRELDEVPERYRRAFWTYMSQPDGGEVARFYDGWLRKEFLQNAIRDLEEAGRPEVRITYVALAAKSGAEYLVVTTEEEAFVIHPLRSDNLRVVDRFFLFSKQRTRLLTGHQAGLHPRGDRFWWLDDFSLITDYLKQFGLRNFQRVANPPPHVRGPIYSYGPRTRGASGWGTLIGEIRERNIDFLDVKDQPFRFVAHATSEEGIDFIVMVFGKHLILLSNSSHRVQRHIIFIDLETNRRTRYEVAPPRSPFRWER